MNPIKYKFYKLFSLIFFYFKGLNSKNIFSIGFPYINIDSKGRFDLKGKMIMINTAKESTLGKNQKCKITVYKSANLSINGDIYMSNAVIIATKCIEIGHNVMIGGGTTIVDSDFHSMDFNHWNTPQDEINMNSKKVTIGNNVFIGMDSLILKGVSIGDGAIIAARSVISKDIPSNEIWGGNPAKFIKKRIQ